MTLYNDLKSLELTVGDVICRQTPRSESSGMLEVFFMEIIKAVDNVTIDIGK